MQSQSVDYYGYNLNVAESVDAPTMSLFERPLVRTTESPAKTATARSCENQLMQLCLVST